VDDPILAALRGEDPPTRFVPKRVALEMRDRAFVWGLGLGALLGAVVGWWV
jgi:hypothetical protein